MLSDLPTLFKNTILEYCLSLKNHRNLIQRDTYHSLQSILQCLIDQCYFQGVSPDKGRKVKREHDDFNYNMGITMFTCFSKS